jgi:hypothetical protein
MHVVLVHQDDRPNGSTTVVPWNAIEIDAVPPTGADSIGNTDDWLTYVFTHDARMCCTWTGRPDGPCWRARCSAGRSSASPTCRCSGRSRASRRSSKRERTRPAARRRLPRDRRRRRARKSTEASDRVNGGLIAWPSGQGWYCIRRAFQGSRHRYGRERLVSWPIAPPPHSLHHVRCVQGGLRQEPGRVVEEFEAASRMTDDAAVGPELQFGQSNEVAPTTVAPQQLPRLGCCPHAAHRPTAASGSPPLTRTAFPASIACRVDHQPVRVTSLRRHRPLAGRDVVDLRPARSHARRGADERSLRLRSPHRAHTTAHARRAPGRSRFVGGRHAAGRGRTGRRFASAPVDATALLRSSAPSAASALRPRATRASSTCSRRPAGRLMARGSSPSIGRSVSRQVGHS